MSCVLTPHFLSFSCNSAMEGNDEGSDSTKQMQLAYTIVKCVIYCSWHNFNIDVTV